MIWPSASCDLLEDGLQPLLELAAVLRAGDQRADVERDDAAVRAAARGRRRRRCAGRGPRRSRSCRRRARRSGPGCSSCGGTRTWMTRRISSSRPMTGSSLPSSAACVRSRPNFSSDWYLSSGFSSVTRCGPRTALDRGDDVLLARAVAAQRLAGGGAVGGEREQQVLGGDVLVAELAELALGGAQDGDQLARDGRLGRGAGIVGSLSSAALTSPRMASGRAPSLLSTGTTMPSSCSSRTASRCSGVASVWLRAAASDAGGLEGLAGLGGEAIKLHA